MAMPHDGYAKVLEECSELGVIAAKRISVNGDSYYDDRNLHKETMEEVADVLAAIDYLLLTNFYPYEMRIIRARRKEKLAKFKQWAKEVSFHQPVIRSINDDDKT